MRAKEREIMRALSHQGLMSFLEHMAAYCQKVKGKPWAPWLRPGQDHAQLRRTAERLRSGEFDLDDPRLPAPVLADMIDCAIEKELTLRAILREQRENRAMEMFFQEKFAEQRRRSYVAGFHRLKKSAKAADPDNPVAERAKRMHRKLRQRRGARRRKRGADVAPDERGAEE